MPNMTNAQKAEKAAKDANARMMQRAARYVLFVGLAVSTGANVMQSWDLGWKGWVIAGLAPVSLFGCLLLLELLKGNVGIAKLILSYTVLGGIALIAGYVSYLHIYRLSYETTGDVRISALVPFMIDFPMIIASVLLSEARKALTLTQVPARVAKPVATTTEPARAIVAKPARQSRKAVSSAQPITA